MQRYAALSKCAGRGTFWHLQLLAANSTLEFTRSPQADKETWCLLPSTPVLPTATKRFDRAGYGKYSQFDE